MYRMEPALQRRLQQLTQESVVHGSPGTILRVHVPAFRAGYAAAAGRFAQDEGRTLRPHDPFRVASVTKTVTAATVLRLAEVGAVALDEAIAEYLEPDLVARVHVIGGRSYADSITLRHLLTHTSGIHDYFDKPFLAEVAAHPDRCWAPRELVEYAVTHGPPSFPPGEGFHYCDTGYVLAGLAVERTTGSPLHEVYRALVLDPSTWTRRTWKGTSLHGVVAFPTPTWTTSMSASGIRRSTGPAAGSCRVPRT